MKIDRLIGILSILLQQEKVTAPYLADKFEVSRRTINRDIEDICRAGIPLVTTQGQNGGISIMEGYKLDRTVFSTSEMEAIFAGLKSLDSVSNTKRYRRLMDKLSMKKSTILDADSHMLIDLSSYYKSTLAPKIEQIQSAITDNKIIQFTYYSPSGKSTREIEPYLLVFQWASWYVWGYCRKRQDFRLFKLNRMRELAKTEIDFTPKELPEFKIVLEKVYPSKFEVKALFEPEMEWRLVDEYGMENFEKREDGKLLFRFQFSDKENLFSWLLSFGSKVILLEPEEWRIGLEERLKEILKNYQES